METFFFIITLDLLYFKVIECLEILLYCLKCIYPSLFCVCIAVEGGHRAIIFSRIGGVQEDIYHEGLHFRFVVTTSQKVVPASAPRLV